jgi:hypothetical protein
MTKGTQRVDRRALLKWRQKVESLGFTDFVSPEDGFKTLDLARWSNDKSTGVYCWLAQNGEVYVGKAKAVRRRLLDHLKVHKDILLASFRKVNENNLDEVEGDCVREMNEKYPVRNIKYARRTSAYVPFDSYLSKKDCEVFLLGDYIMEKQGWESQGWESLTPLEIKQRTKFKRFAMQSRRLKILSALRLFIVNCIPNPAKTENRFWSVSLYPGTDSPGYTRLLFET